MVHAIPIDVHSKTFYMIIASYFPEYHHQYSYSHKENEYCYNKYFYRCRSLDKVPGPLPILGVGGAFIWSRKLRNRIKESNSSGGNPNA